MQDTAYPFPHRKLEVFHVSLEIAALAKKVADGIPRGHRSLADQILRASSSVVLNIGEGANRYTSGANRQRYSEARGEAGEAAAVAELFAVLHLVAQEDCDALLAHVAQVGAKLTGLLRSVAL